MVGSSRRLLLRAEMRLPGVALLEFALEGADDGDGSGTLLVQRAVFQPRGLAGYLYWWVLWPVHVVLSPRMIRSIVRSDERGGPVCARSAAVAAPESPLCGGGA